ncbi:MAG: tetratricopeptide repeat-containing sulfotransferase family protein [Geminicoccaceae bacterium]
MRCDELIEAGRAALKDGNDDAARLALERAAAIRLGDPNCLGLLAEAYIRGGDKVKAQRVLNKLLMLRPDHVAALSALRKLELELGNTKRAAELTKATSTALKQRIARGFTSLPSMPKTLVAAIVGRLRGTWPDLVTARLCVRASAALADRRLPEAEALLQRAHGLAPDHPQVLLLLARFLMAAGNADAALVHLSQAAAAAPGDITIELATIDALARAYQVDEARKRLDALPETARASRTARLAEARACRAHGQIEEARAKFAELRDDQAGGEIDHVIALLDASAGRKEDAKEGFERAARRSPRFGHIFWSATLSRCIEKDNVLFAAARTLSKDVEASQFDRALAELAIGRALIKADEKFQGFAHLERGNAMTPMIYDQEEQAAWVDRLCATFKSPLYGAYDLPDRGEGRIFVVGLPRSGSSLVEQILASHAQVHGAGENPALPNLVARLDADGTYQDMIERCAQDELTSVAESYLAAVESGSEAKPVVVDKNLYNLYHLGLIALIFPKAKVVHCRRGVMDNGFSIYSHWFSASYPYATDLQNIGHHYGEYRRLMDHWQTTLPIQIYDIHHERLIEDQAGETNKLLEFLDLPFDQSCIDFHQSQRAVATSSLAQVRQGITRTSVGSWRAFETELEPLRQAVLPFIESETGQSQAPSREPPTRAAV